MVRVMITIDTEEDDWGSYAARGARVRNIGQLPEVHELFQRYGARPTYFVNRPPLVDAAALDVLGTLARDAATEIATHCHPWNTPPFDGPAGVAGSMMCNLPRDTNRGKIAGITRLMEDALQTRPRSFRTGRWGFGPTVAGALVDTGYEVDSSVSPFVNWTALDGPDYASAPLLPYRFAVDDVLTPRADGALTEVPTTVAALRGHPVRQARWRAGLEAGPFARFKVVGLLDQLGVAARRWLSPEQSSASEMIALADNLVKHDVGVLGMTFHSCTLLAGATPFVRSVEDRVAFQDRIEAFLAHCRDLGWSFATVGEVGASVGAVEMA